MLMSPHGGRASGYFTSLLQVPCAVFVPRDLMPRQTASCQRPMLIAESRGEKQVLKMAEEACTAKWCFAWEIAPPSGRAVQESPVFPKRNLLSSCLSWLWSGGPGPKHQAAQERRLGYIIDLMRFHPMLPEASPTVGLV